MRAEDARAVALGVDAVYIKDPSGLLTPERVETLMPAIKDRLRRMPAAIFIRTASRGLHPTPRLQRNRARRRRGAHGDLDAGERGFASGHRKFRCRMRRRSGFDVRSICPVEEVAERLRYIAGARTSRRGIV